MIRSRRLRMFCVILPAAVAVSLGWLAPARWLKTPAPRAVIPVGAEHGVRFVAGAVFAPSGSLFATICADPADGHPPSEGSTPQVIRLWDCDTGESRAELLRPGENQLVTVEFSSDGKRVRVHVREFTKSPLGAGYDLAAFKDSSRCWDTESLTECDPNEPFQPFSEGSWPLNEALDSEMSRMQLACSPTDSAPRADAVAFLSNKHELRLVIAGEHSSRKIADAPRGRDTEFAISPDAKQFVMNTPPHTSTGWSFVDRVWHWLDPTLDPPDPDADEDEPSDTVTYAADVASGRVVACWKTPHVFRYRFSPDGRTLAVVSAEQTAFYDAPLREPWARRLAAGLAAGAVTFPLAWLVLTPGALLSRLRKLVPFSPALRKRPA
jgi:hypothetical protein